MQIRKVLLMSLVTGIILSAAVIAVLTRGAWMPWFGKARSPEPAQADSHTHDETGRVRLTPQARGNLRLIVEPVKLQSYWRSVQVPGAVVETPGQGDRVISSPVSATVQKIMAVPGDTLPAGTPLFTLRLISEFVQNTQSDLFKSAREIQINKEKKERLAAAARTGVVPEANLIEVDNQLQRLTTAFQAYHQELLTRGLTPEQIAEVVNGKFVKEITIVAPRRAVESRALTGGAPATQSSGTEDPSALTYEVQDLKVQVGEQVQAGQALGTLANHQALLIEGRAFMQEAPLLEKAAQQGWPIRARLTEDAGDWPAFDAPLQIRYFANTMDPVSRTFPFYIPLVNSSRTFVKDGRTFLVWRFRPGQRVRLEVPVEQFADVFVLPREAAAREGPDMFVFRQNGDFFERKTVHVLYEDRQNVVLANDGSISAGLHVARNAAAALNRILKAQAARGEEGHDEHHHQHDH